MLQRLLANQPAAPAFADLLVGTETADDAAVWQLVGDTCVIATTGFFMPIVDDPADFGRIAADAVLLDLRCLEDEKGFLDDLASLCVTPPSDAAP